MSMHVTISGPAVLAQTHEPLSSSWNVLAIWRRRVYFRGGTGELALAAVVAEPDGRQSDGDDAHVPSDHPSGFELKTAIHLTRYPYRTAVACD